MGKKDIQNKHSTELTTEYAGIQGKLTSRPFTLLTQAAKAQRKMLISLSHRHRQVQTNRFFGFNPKVKVLK